MMSVRANGTFSKPYWVVGNRATYESDGFGWVIWSEEDAYATAEERGCEVIERHDPDGTKTVIS
jgi:hypothetical protein